MTGFYRYRVCGFTCASELELPGVPRSSVTHAAAVCIRVGETPAALPSATERGAAYEASPDEFLLRIPSVAQYLVRNGGEIIVQPAVGAAAADVRLFLTGSAFGALLHQRGLLPLHASAVRVDNICVAFLGCSGAGKSTLCALLNQRGYAVVCDDICPVQVLPGIGAVAHPGFPRLRLWKDSAEAVENRIDDLDQPVRQGLDKYELPVANGHSGSWLPLARLYLLCEARDGEPEGIEIVEGPDRLQILLDHTYRFQFLKGLNRRREHFRACTALVGTVLICRLTRPRLLSRLSEAADWLERDFERPLRCEETRSRQRSA
jgi:hypothetical protein